MTIGENIKRLREGALMTQEELAQRVDVSRPMICQIERGTKTPSLPLSVRLAAELNCTLDDLVDEREVAP